MMTSRSTLACLAIQAPQAESIGASMAVLLSIIQSRITPPYWKKLTGRAAAHGYPSSGHPADCDEGTLWELNLRIPRNH